MSDELKPCPFCGGAAKFDHDNNGWNWIVCGVCQASTNCRVSIMEDCKPLLTEQWNRRTAPEGKPVAWVAHDSTIPRSRRNFHGCITLDEGEHVDYHQDCLTALYDHTNALQGQIDRPKKLDQPITTAEALGDELDEDHPLWCVNKQVEGLLEGVGAYEDHEEVVRLLLTTGLPKSTVDRIHRAIVGAELP